MVDVVIVARRNSPATLSACIAAVRRWPRCGRVVVVDNGSPTSTAAAAALSDQVVGDGVNVGFGAGQNRGRAATTSPYLLVLNPDALVEPAGLDAGWEVLAADPGVAMVQGRIVRSADGADEQWFGRPPGLGALVARLLTLRERLGEERLRRLAARLGQRDYADRRVPEAATRCEFVATVAPLVRREALEAVGGFDEAYFLYAEDIDLCFRLRRAGWELVAIDRPWATHVGGASSASSRRTRDLHWWESHRLMVASHWKGARRSAGLVVASTGVRRARRRARSGP